MATRRIALMRPSQIFDSFLDDFLTTPSLGFGNSGVDIDMYESEDGNSIVVSAKVPGIKPDNVDITVEDNVLTLSYESKEEKEEEDKKKKYYYKEIKESSFTRSVTLPQRVDSEKANADFKDGILTITLPKLEEAKPKKVTITTGQK
jgi:HSP20 family protein